jgi:Flp pilus assembly protein TadD
LIWGDEALALAIHVAGDDAPDTASLYAVVAAIHQRAGRPERALPLFRKAHAIYDRTIPPTDLRYPLLLTSEALPLMDDRRFAEAEKELRQAIKLLGPCESQCSFVLAIAENNLGLLRMVQKKYADAATFLRSALAREEQYSMLPSGDILHTLKLLLELRELQHRHDESAALKLRITEMESSYR